MSAFDRLPERLQGGNEVKIVRVDDKTVAVVFAMGSKGNADIIADKALRGLQNGKLTMTIRGKVVEVTGP